MKLLKKMAHILFFCAVFSTYVDYSHAQIPWEGESCTEIPDIDNDWVWPQWDNQYEGLSSILGEFIDREMCELLSVEYENNDSIVHQFTSQEFLNYMEQLWAAELEATYTRLSDILSGAFKVVGPESLEHEFVDINLFEWSPAPVAVKGRFVLRVPTFGMGGVTITVSGPGVSETFLDNGQTADILVEPPSLGAHSYDTSIEFCFPDDNPSGISCDAFTVNTQPVIVEPESQDAYFADYTDIHATNYPNLCAPGFLGLAKTTNSNGLCVRGGFLPVMDQPSTGAVDIIACNSIGCSSGYSFASGVNGAISSLDEDLGNTPFVSVTGFCNFIDLDAENILCDFFKNNFAYAFGLQNLWETLFGEGEEVGLDCSFEPLTGRFCIQVQNTINRSLNTVVANGSGGIEAQISQNFPDYPYYEIRESALRHENKHITDYFSLAKNPQAWQCSGILQPCPQQGRIIAYALAAGLFLEKRAYETQRAYLQARALSTSDPIKKAYIQDFIDSEVDPMIGLIDSGIRPSELY